MFDIAGVMEEYIDDTYAYEGVGKIIKGIMSTIANIIRSIISIIGKIIGLIGAIPLIVISKFQEKLGHMTVLEKMAYKQGELVVSKVLQSLRDGTVEGIKTIKNMENEFNSNNNDSNASESFSSTSNKKIDINSEFIKKVAAPLKEFKERGYKISPEFAKKSLQKLTTAERAYRALDKRTLILIRKMNNLPDNASVTSNDSSIVSILSASRGAFTQLYGIYNAVLKGTSTTESSGKEKASNDGWILDF